jgi:hypothetical protein
MQLLEAEFQWAEDKEAGQTNDEHSGCQHTVTRNPEWAQARESVDGVVLQSLSRFRPHSGRASLASVSPLSSGRQRKASMPENRRSSAQCPSRE